MKYLVAVVLLFSSFCASAQDIRHMLANASSRKWIGANVYDGTSSENSYTLTFYRNQTLRVTDRSYGNTRPQQNWWIKTGEFVTDRDIVVMIGAKYYSVEFSKTNNGRDFMTLTRIKQDEDDDLVIKTYYAAD